MLLTNAGSLGSDQCDVILYIFHGVPTPRCCINYPVFLAGTAGQIQLPEAHIALGPFSMAALRLWGLFTFPHINPGGRFARHRRFGGFSVPGDFLGQGNIILDWSINSIPMLILCAHTRAGAFTMPYFPYEEL